jgi:hypothetical protein
MRLIILISILNILLFADGGEDIFKKRCSSCHQTYIPQPELLKNYFDSNNSDLNLTAPTLVELSYWLRDRVGDRKGDRESQIMEIEEFLYNYLKSPDINSSIIPKGILRHFKQMPKVDIGEDEVEALAIYLFDIGRKIVKEYGVKIYPTYQEALEVAKRENKIVMVEGFITYCRGCIKMDREVFIDDRVKKALERDFVVTKINVLREKLPLGLKSLGTPSFYFITSDGKRVIDQIVGTGTVDEFLELLEDIRDSLKRGEFYK